MRNTGLFLILFIPVIVIAGISISSKMTQEYYAEAGRTVYGEILVRNSSSSSAEVVVYLNDYLFYADGSNVYGEAGLIARSNAKWISLDPERAVIDANSSLIIDYVISIPDERDLQGSYWSMVMVEEVAKRTNEPEEQQVALTINTRFGIQLITNFGHGIIPEIEFINTEMVMNENEPIVIIDLENTGIITTRSKLKVEVYDMEGNFIGLFEGERKRTYPGTSVRLRCSLNGLEGGVYSALIIAECDEENIFGANVKLEI